MKLNLFQYSPVWESKQANIEKINSIIDQYDISDSVVIFPELSLTGFTMESLRFAETVNEDSSNYFKSLAKKYGCHLLCGIILKEGDKRYNSLLHFDPSGKLTANYKKIHPFSYSSEEKYYRRGAEPVITNINGCSTGLSICYDLRFPELYRYYGKERTHLIVNIANWPVTRIEHWRTLLKARAIENQCFIAGVNRIGNDPKLEYPGYSSIFDPMGKELISSVKEEVVSFEIDLSTVDEVRAKFPFLNDIILI